MPSTAHTPNPRPVRPDLERYALHVSAYDRVAGMLLALLVLVGSIVAIMVVMWLTSRIFGTQVAVPVIMEQIGDGGPMGIGDELEPPAFDETDLVQPELTDTLTAVADAIATSAAILDNPAIYAEINQQGGGAGDGRLGGPGGGGRPGSRRRWEFRFGEGNTVQTYARQLDFFGIELGVLMPGNQVEYASNLSKATPDRRTGPADKEKRYYLTWRRGALEAADRELLRRAGITPGQRLILKFIPPQLEQQLLGLERDKAGTAEKAKLVTATYFGVVPEGRGFRFYVMDQRYKPGG